VGEKGVDCSDGSKFWTDGLGFVKGKNGKKDEEEEEMTENRNIHVFGNESSCYTVMMIYPPKLN